MKNKYQYTSGKENYEDYSSGRVLYGVKGATNFPVRLSSEIFQHCVTYLKNQEKQGPYTIYDPFCGVAYSLTVMGFIHGGDIASIIASDADGRLLEFAQKNLSLMIFPRRAVAENKNRITLLSLRLTEIIDNRGWAFFTL